MLPPALVSLASNVFPLINVACSLVNAAVVISSDEVSWKMKRTAVRAKSSTVDVIVFSSPVEAGAEDVAAGGESPVGAAKMMLLEV